MDGGFVSSFCFFVYVWFISLDGGLNFVALFCPVTLPSCSSLVYVLVPSGVLLVVLSVVIYGTGLSDSVPMSA